MSASGGATGATALTGQPTDTVVSSGVVANVASVATMAGAVGVTNYISGIMITGQAPTAAATITCTVFSGATPLLRIVLDLPAAANAPFAPVAIMFPRPIPALAVNTATSVNCPAFGAGSTAQATDIIGFRQ